MRQLWNWFRRRLGNRRRQAAQARSGPLQRGQLRVERLEERTLLSTTPVIGSGNGLVGTYFHNENLTAPQVTRVDPTINFNWGWQTAPAAGMPNVQWSVRWTGQVQAEYSQTYTFSTVSDDGIKLIVNGQTLINDWTDHAPRTDSGSINLVAGQKYAIEVDYYQDLGGATAQLFWSSPSTAREIVPQSQLYASNVVWAVSAGGHSAGVYQADTGFSGGTTYSTGASIDTSAVSNPAPQAVYQNQRYGNFTYTATGLTPGGTYTVRLDLAEIYWDSANQRLFNVTINGTQVLTDFDIFARAGGKNKALVETFSATANAQGAITIGFITVKDNAEINGIAILTAGSSSAPQSGPASGSPDWFSQHLQDPALVGLVRSLDAGGSFSRTDMLAVFSQVEKNGAVSATDLADLRTLVANGSFLGMPGYVQELANKVINGDPANALYQGQALGNLAVGSSSPKLQELVNKWFLGLDYPVAISGTTYAYAAGTLFGSGGPSYSDVVQGDVGDCYFCAALAELAADNPAAIRSMFIDNGDGTYTVRFYDNGVADYVTVNRYFPERSNGTFFYANWWNDSLSNANNVLWVALAEKAYAQLAASGWSRPDVANSYDALNNGWEGTVLNQVANIQATAQLLAGNSATKTAIVNAVAAGRMVAIDSNASTAAPVISDHVYVVLSYNVATQTFLTYNPWGYTQTLTWTQIENNFSFWSEA
jgi:hypothetical protein